jgi:hypothetical protein
VNKSGLIILFIILGILGPHFLNSLLSILSLIIIYKLFYVKNLPLVIFGGLVFQWLQINVKIWVGNLEGFSLPEMFSFYQNEPQLYTANFLSNIGLIAFTLGFYVVAKKAMRNFNEEKFELELFKYNPNKILNTYLLFTFLLTFLFSIRSVVPGLNTAIVAATHLKWGLFVISFYYLRNYPSLWRIFVLVILIEIILSLTSFFSDFKDYFIFAIISYVFLFSYFTRKSLAILFLLATVTVFFALVWTAIKFDYRSFLAGGERSQQVVVSNSDALSEFTNLAFSLDNQNLIDSKVFLIDRISYIEFFSITLDVVPNQIEYQDGKIWQQAVQHVLMPRLFFPNKPMVDDSDHTNKYTGLHLMGDAQASHSIGYMTDFYIDYGPVLMHLGIFVLGMIMGFFYKYLLTKTKNEVWAIIYTVPFYFFTSAFSVNLLKVVSNLMVYMLFILLFGRLITKYVEPYLMTKKTRKQQLNNTALSE